MVNCRKKQVFFSYEATTSSSTKKEERELRQSALYRLIKNRGKTLVLQSLFLSTI
jgi:hypothetical protein